MNDSGRIDGEGRRVPLAQFIAAWEDDEYSYIVTGDKPPRFSSDETLAKRAAIENNIIELYLNSGFDEDQAKMLLSESFEKTIQSQSILKDLDPDVRVLAEEYLEDVKADKRAVLENSGLDPDEIERLMRELDIE